MVFTGDNYLVATWLGSFMIALPFVAALLMLLVFKWKADTTGFSMWVIMLIIAVAYFKTNTGVVFLASIAGFIKSYPIALMVCTSIFMITYMQKTGALQRIIVAFKTLGGVGKEPFQIMFINIGLGCFLVSIGATPVTMLPPIMTAIGYSSLAFAINGILLFFIPLEEGYSNLFITIPIAITIILFSIGNLIGWIMPQKLKDFFNRNYKVPTDDSLSEKDLIDKIKGELLEGD